MQWIGARLSPWTAWSLRDQINGSNLPGVYLLGHFDTAPGTVDPQDRRIIYVGETHAPNQGLKWRWRAFERCAFGTKAGSHAGGNTYQETFPGATQKADLCVSALPIDLSQPWYSAFILAAERLLIWEYAVRHYCLPRCNKL